MKVGLFTAKTPNVHSEPNFQKRGGLNALSEEVSKKSGWIPRTLTYLGQNDGEILNTLVTAVGTAVIAPIFIAGNPLSKEDAETKWYTAMRQPISAVIALIMQLWVNKEFNNFMDKGGSTGQFGAAYDLSAMPKSKYLQRIIKLEHPEYTKEQVSAEISKRQMLAERRRIAELRQEYKGKNIETSELVSKDIFDEAKKQLTKEFKDAHKNELSGSNTTEMNEFLEKHLSKEKINARALENIEKTVEFEAKAKFKIRELAKQFSDIDSAIKHLNELTPANANEKDIINNVLNRLETIKIFEESKGMQAFSSVKDLGKNYEEVLHNVKVKHLLKARTSNAAKALSSANKWLGIVVSLVTLPFSCGALNWAYPRVMEKIMPTITKWIHRNDSPKEVAVNTNIEKTDGGDDDED